MKNIITYLIQIATLLAPMFAFSQIALTVDPNLIKPVTGDLTAEQLEQIVNTTQRIISTYAERSSLRDAKTNLVTGESVKSFRNLFAPDASIPRDFMMEVRDVIQIQDYGDQILSNMPDGFQVLFNGAVLKEIKYDVEGFYVVVVDIEKTRYNYVDEEGEVRISTSGKILKQTVFIDIPEKALERGLINRIGLKFEGKEDLPAAKDMRILGLSVAGGLSTLNFTESSFWNAEHTEALFESKGNLMVSIGGEFITTKLINPSRSPNKSLVFSLGLRYAIDGIETNLENFHSEPFTTLAYNTDSTAIQQYRRKVGPINADEKLNVHIIEIPIGLGISIINKRQTRLILHARAIPRIVLNGDGDLQGPALYDGVLIDKGELSKFLFLREGAIKPGLLNNEFGFAAYQVGNTDLNLASTPEFKSSLAVQLSPTLYLDLTDYNPTWGLLIGVDLTYQPNYILTPKPGTTDILRFASDTDYQSVAQHYTDKISAFGYGLRFGLYSKLMK